MSFMPSCRHLTEHASDYLDHTLPFWKRMGMRLHLFICVNCRRHMRHMKLTIASLARLHEMERPATTEPAAVNAVVQKIKQESTKR